MTAAIIPTLEESKRRLIAALADWYEPVDPCEHGHVAHGPEAHRGRHLVHTYAGHIGADWDYDAAVAFILAADRVIKSNPLHASMDHGGAAHLDGRWIAFATKDVQP